MTQELPKFTRQTWIELAQYSLSRLKHSAHNMDKRQSAKEFLEDLERVMNIIAREENT